MKVQWANKSVDSRIVVPAGFRFASGSAGIKKSGHPDVAFVEATEGPGANAAALFTRNLVQAAPVHVGREHLQRSGGRVRALVVNSGNANCATGDAGLRAARKVCREVSKLLHLPLETVFPSSTGIIGAPLPVEKLERVLPQVLANASSTENAALGFAQAIMTTDTRPKSAAARLKIGKREVRLLGIAKGAGMIHPDLATMLVYLFTDIAASPAQLRKILSSITDETFNCISVDGDTSTNDTVLLLASGASGVSMQQAGKTFQNALESICQSLARQIVADGEGVRHVVQLVVEGMRTREGARALARAVSTSLLVKTAWAGADPNWGRILAAMGRAGVKVDPNQVQIYFGPHQVCGNGAALPFDAKAAHRYLSQPEYMVRIRTGKARNPFIFMTCDLTAEYVRVNADYST